MANIKRIPPEPPQPEVPGGRRRASRRVDLDKYPAVARRQSINVRLMSGLCGHDTEPRAYFAAADAAMLAIIAGERFDAAHIALRRQALAALAETQTLESADQLAATALASIEDPSARAIALNALARASPWLARAVAANVGAGSDVVHACARELLERSARTGKRRVKAKRRQPAKDSTRR
jgi:hypothetical protein